MLYGSHTALDLPGAKVIAYFVHAIPRNVEAKELPGSR